MKLLVQLSVLVIFVSSHVFGQSDKINTLVKSFSDYQSKAIQEKIFVHTDRNFFVTGEVLWMKIYCLESTANIPISISKVAYVELMDSNNKAILQSKIELTNGSGYGSLFLPASINSGNYVLRIYTNWMKNFSAEFYFQQQLTIVNPFKRLESLTEISQNANRVELKFYPEGGSLVKGLPSTVGFKVNDELGNGIHADGIILANGKDTVTRFSTLHFGLGSFSFTPQASNVYEAILLSEKSKQRFKLPPSLDSGCTVHLSESADSKVKMSVQSSFQSGTPLYIVVHSGNTLKAAKANVVIDGKTQFVFAKDQLGNGIIHFTLFDNNLNPICERLHFIRSKNKVDLNATADKPIYYPRQKISIVIEAKEELLLSNLNASISVHAFDSLINNPQINILTFTKLTSELRGAIESPEFYLGNNDEFTNKALDNLMLVHGWSRYSWNSILHQDSTLPLNLPEVNGHLIQGKTVNKITNKPVPGIIALLGAPNKIIHSYTSQSNKEGTIYFEMKNFYDAQRIFVQSLPGQNDSVKIQIEDPFSANFSSFKPTTFKLNSVTEHALLQKSIAMQSLSIFQPAYRGKLAVVTADSTNFYGKADEDYLLDDYTRFKSMEEVMREYVPGVLIKKRKDDFIMRVINTPINRQFEKHPLVLLDGVPIFNATKIMDYDPLKVKRLEVMTRPYYVGALVADGVVSFTSFKGLAEGLEIDENTVALDYEGLQRKKEFYSPDYSTVLAVQSRLADFRDLLYWNPSIVPDKDGKIHIEFYSSDKVGKYEINIQGITKGGKAIVGRSYFSVIR